MKQLQPVGFFRELAHGDPHGPSLKDNIADLPQEHEAEIVHYLQHGILYIATPGIAYDVLSKTARPSTAPHMLTDGTWVWPADLAYYVYQYHCRLPSVFIDDMRSHNWRLPEDASMKRISQTDWGRLEQMTDDEIDYSEIPPLTDEFFARAKAVFPRAVELEPDVLAWFEKQGQDYLVRINEVLRQYIARNKQKAS